MRIINLKDVDTGGSVPSIEPGDVKITTKNFETGYFNLNFQSYLKRKSESNIAQDLSGPCFDLVPISEDQIVADEIDNGYGFELTNGDFIIFTQRIPVFGNRVITISYFDTINNIITDTKTYTNTDNQLFFDAVTNYNDVLYIYKNNSKSINLTKYNKIQKITFDINTKLLSEINEITTQERRITKVIYDKINSRFISYEHNTLSTDINNDKSGIYIDSNFENINNTSYSTVLFSIDHFEFLSSGSIVGLKGTTEEEIDNQIFLFNSRFYYSPENLVYFYNTLTTNIDKIEFVFTEDEIYTTDFISLLDADGNKTNFSQIFNINQRYNNVICEYEVNNGVFYHKAFVKFNNLNSTTKSLFLEKYQNGDYIIIDQVFDNTTFNYEMGIMYSYVNSETSTIQRDVASFDSALYVNVNSINNNTSQSLSNFTINNSHIFNNDQFIIVDNIGAVEYKDKKLKRINYEDFGFPYVYVAQITNAPVGLNYLLKE